MYPGLRLILSASVGTVGDTGGGRGETVPLLGSKMGPTPSCQASIPLPGSKGSNLCCQANIQDFMLDHTALSWERTDLIARPKQNLIHDVTLNLFTSKSIF